MNRSQIYQLDNGLRIHAVTSGSGPPLLLIHGFPETWWCWRHVLPLLAEDHLVIAPDYRGAGLSDKPASGYDKNTMARDLLDVVSRVTDEPLEGIIGHDLGAMVAFAYVGLDQSVRSLTLVDAPIPGTHTWDTIAASPRIWHFGFHATGDLAVELVRDRERLYIEEFIRIRLGDGLAFSPADIDHYAAEYRRPGALRAAFATYASFADDAESNRSILLNKLEIPTLCIGGSLSTSGPLMAQTATEVAQDATASIIDGAGHWVPEERPDDLVEIWREWHDHVP